MMCPALPATAPLASGRASSGALGLLRRPTCSPVLTRRRLLASPQRPSLPRLTAAAAEPTTAAPPTSSATAAASPSSPPTPATAAAAVRAFYDAYNRRDLPALEQLLDPNVVYSDLVYPQPKKGRSAVMAWLGRVSEGAPKDLSFVIEGLAAGEEQLGQGQEGGEGGGEEGAATFGVGVKWHVALLEGQKGQKEGADNSDSTTTSRTPIIFPFSRGCSYVEVDARTGLIVRVRDVVEPSSKPGDLALSLLGGLAPLIRAVGPTAAERAGTVVDRKADAALVASSAIAPSSSTKNTTASSSSPSSSSSPPLPPTALRPTAIALWLFYAGYLSLAMLSDLPPGPPAYATQPEVLLEAFHESVNLLWIAEALEEFVGLPSLVPIVPSHPVSEAIFNLAVVWAAMFVPLMYSDARGSQVKNNQVWAVLVVFVTNLFLTPWMALREGVVLSSGGGGGSGSSGNGEGSSNNASSSSSLAPPLPGLQPVPGYSRALGFASAAAGALCIGWALAGRPEAGGDLAARWHYLSSFAGGDNRVFWAFILDYALFAVWQASMLSGAPAGYRFVPFAGMASWLIVRGGGGDSGRK